MRNRELINRLEKYPDDYEILICHHGYDNVSVEVDHDHEVIYVDGFFSIDKEYTKEEIQKHNNALKRADETFKKVKFIR